MFQERKLRGSGLSFLARLRGKQGRDAVETEPRAEAAVCLLVGRGLFSRPYAWSYEEGECCELLPRQGEADGVPARDGMKRRPSRRLWTRDDGFTLSGARRS